MKNSILKRSEIKYICCLLFILINISCSDKKIEIDQVEISFEKNKMLFIKNDKPFNGIIIERYDDDKIKLKMEIKNGFKNVSKDGTADGIFGSRTLGAVKDFQSANKDKKGNPLKVDGIVGSSTMEALKRKNLHENIIKKVLKRNLEMKNK